MSRPTRSTSSGTNASEDSAATTSLPRRQLVRTIGGLAGLSILAGCSGGSGDGDGNDSPLDDLDGADATDETDAADGAGSADSGDSSDGTDDTGDESTEQVSNNLNVLSAVGTVGADGESVDEIILAVGLAAGSASLDLTAVTIQYVGADSFANLVHSSAARDSDTAFATSAITTEDESDAVMTNPNDRYEIVVPLGRAVPDGGDNSEVTPLDAGETAELTITTDAGAQLTATAQAPDSLAGAASGDTVTL